MVECVNFHFLDLFLIFIACSILAALTVACSTKTTLVKTENDEPTYCQPSISLSRVIKVPGIVKCF